MIRQLTAAFSDQHIVKKVINVDKAVHPPGELRYGADSIVYAGA